MVISLPRPGTLEFSAVSFSYSQRLLLQDVSLRISAGEMVALLGPNGAGKSTLLKLGSGLLKPSRGHILLEGQEVSSLGRVALARRVAVVPQDFSVQFAYTVRQIVELGRLPYLGLWGSAGEGDRGAVAAALEATGMSTLADRVYNELSGGERQRALISLALAQSTPVLLLDEPTAHLDIRHQIQTLELLRRLNQEQGVTVLAALHDLNLAARYFPRLVLFSSGVVADGTPAQVLDEGILSRMYETQVQVGILRGEEHLSVLPLGHLAGRSTTLGERRLVHVVAGGGSGELLMRALADARIDFVAGPLNVGDSDAALAERLGVLCILEPPYAPVSEPGLLSAREHMLSARAVIICPVPLGTGNVRLLEAAYEAQRAGVPVFLYEPALSPETDRGAENPAWAALAARDYSGQGIEAYRKLVDAGSEWLGSNAEVLQRLASPAPSEGATGDSGAGDQRPY
jgi:iron complex transport system ATP-binding protein